MAGNLNSFVVNFWEIPLLSGESLLQFLAKKMMKLPSGVSSPLFLLLSSALFSPPFYPSLVSPSLPSFLPAFLPSRDEVTRTPSRKCHWRHHLRRNDARNDFKFHFDRLVVALSLWCYAPSVFSSSFSFFLSFLSQGRDEFNVAVRLLTMVSFSSLHGSGKTGIRFTSH